MRLRVVCDTNTVLSALIFREGQLAWLRGAWAAREIIPIVSRGTASELLRALAYPKFHLSPADQEALLADYLPFAETVAPTGVRNPPRCRDPDDRMFPALAKAARADALVTGDKDLLGLAAEFPIPILKPAQLRARLGH